MGVPKFFRYISERYPNLSELIGSAELPQFDNMYLDMNGIIHVCSHPDDSNVHFRMSEAQMFRDILHYIDTLFHMIKPRKLFFMAVDGVAPRAKMNQQRSRRFQSARTALELIEKAKQANEKLPEESRFDSNCITPGTEFMERLQQAFKHFVKLKLSTDPAWRHCRIIISGHETPGEGEHKVMEYIRYLKAQPSYDPNTRHCLYGLDADLIMLGLCTHESNFALLREEVKFDKNAKRAPSVDETKFYLLHLGLLRDYLELEFIELKPNLTFEYDLEKIIDDWVFMCFMVGNDFLPNLPSLHINSNALPILYKAYKSVLPKLDGYLNDAGKLNLSRFEVFMEAMSEVDRDLFRQNYEDLKFMETKYNNNETFADEVTEITAETKSDLNDLIKQTNLDFGSDESSISDLEIGESDENDGLMFSGQDPKEVFKDCDVDEDLSDDELFEREFTLHKRDYYINKLKYPEMTEEVLAEQTKCYITALQWTLSYYYRGVCSWSWHYPHHYAPYMSDIKNFKELQLDFNLGKPFLPFEQLLSVLPAASKDLLPKVYHKLMTDPLSKIIDYYPVNFETDLNGKKQEWEALVLIPFINEMRLMDAMNDCNHELTESEQNRNKHGPMLQYDYCAIDQGSEPECFGQQMIGHVFCTETRIDRSELIVPDDKLVLGPCSGAQKDVYFPGFPTMRHLKHSGTLEIKRVKVFHQPSRNESMIIRIDESLPDMDIETLAKHFMGKEIYVGWPHLREAKVIAVSDAKTKIEKTGIEHFKEGNGNTEFKLLAKHVKDHHLLRLGVDLREVDQLLHVYPLLNREYIHTGDGKLTLSKNWSKIPLAVARISVVENLVVFAKDMEDFKHVEDVFTKDSTVFLMNKGYYGCQATISDSKLYSGRIKLSAIAHQQPDFNKARKMHYEELQNYMNSFTASSAVGMNPHLFNRISGVVFVYNGTKRYPISDNDKKVNIGLQLKHFKQNEEVPGYTKSANNQWLYSQKAVNLVHEYSMKFPRLFQLMNQQTNSQTDPLFESELNVGQKEGEESLLKKIQQWLNESPCKTIGRQPCGTECLSKQSIEQVAKTVESLENGPVRKVNLQVKPHLLYMPNLNEINVLPDSTATFELFDRVVIVRDQYTVPLGTRGTIISILPRVDPNPIRQENVNVVDYIYEILFDKPFELGTSIPDVAEKRVFKVRKSVLMNITHGSGRPIKEQTKMNSNGLRQRNGAVNEPTPPNAWRVLERKPAQRIEINERKLNEPQANAVPANSVAPNPNRTANETFELVNLADKVNIAERLKKQKERDANIATEDDILKKLLGVGQNKPAIFNEPPMQSPNTQKLDLNSLFGKASINDLGNGLPNPSSLPKPPTAWHKNSTKKEPKCMPAPPLQLPPHHQQQPQHQPSFLNNHPMNMMGAPLQHRPQYFPPQMHNMQPPPPPHPMNMPYGHMYRMPLFIPNHNYSMPMMPPGPHNMPGPQPQPFMQTPHHIRMSAPGPHFDGLQSIPSPIMHNSPEGPQKLKTKSGTASAFIPLQAARKGAKPKSNVNNTQPANDMTKKDANLDKPEEQESKQEEKIDAQPIVNAKTKSSPAKSAKPADTKPKDSKKDATKSNDKPLPKRLAANFSVPAPKAK